MDIFTLVEIKPGSDAAAISAAVAPLIPEGFQLSSSFQSPALETGVPPVYALVIGPSSEGLYREDAAERSPKEARQLVILMREDNSRYRVVVRSLKALVPYGWDAHFPDSLSELMVTGNRLRIFHYGGGRQRWGREDVFTYDHTRDMWYWEGTTLDYTDSLNLEAEGEQWKISPETLGEIPLTEFDITSKTFHSVPQL